MSSIPIPIRASSAQIENAKKMFGYSLASSPHENVGNVGTSESESDSEEISLEQILKGDVDVKDVREFIKENLPVDDE